jgi:flagellar motor switch protein FliN/FliY
VVDAASDSHVGVLVHPDLGEALAAAPAGGLDLGSAVQPALDAAATALGVTAGPGQTLAGPALAEMVARATVAVPLLAGADVAAVVFLVTPAGAPVAAPAPTPVHSVVPARGVEMLHGVAMEVTVELGRTRLSVRELLALAPGDVLELDRAAGSPADLLVNGRLIARGEVVVVDEDFALRVTEIVPQSAAV